ncbi:aminoglycoside phosphotransferase [Sphingomonas sp. Leaf339]|uniref:aminoglycoside phosphotransferase family protein n=1 Tax=Sphingomonas sp. Leaf339 TaxID=1736343 RepID=UPI00070170B4|nr:phosphotransferase [Sphingomonas sp. Leaf339]KQU56061.1 aminoglycoside phosphotransferase [Sphingomonas sp. Leaf339]
MLPPAGAAAFLTAHGWGEALIEPLAGDASFRRYFRVMEGNRSAVLMDAPPPHEDCRPFVTMARWLEDAGFLAPAILALDEHQGLLLLSDLGDVRLRETVDQDSDEELVLYAQAVDLLIDLTRQPAGPVPPYDRAVLHREAALFVEWYCPAVGIDADMDSYRAAWDAVFDHAHAAEPVTVLRDYHAENLMLVGDDRRLGLLDFQDALAGHPAYDLVSLLQDARRDVDPAIETTMLDRYCAASKVGDDFLRAYHVLGAQRNAKIIGIFTRLWKRDGKSRYAGLCPRVWTYLERDLAQPVLAPVAAWFDTNVPADRRGDPLAIAPFVATSA